MKIGILYVCTGKYTIFWEDFYLSCEKYFISEVEKHYFVFTDADNIDFEKENSRIHRIYQKNLGWPDNTLRRFSMFLGSREKFSDMDYIFFFNANLLVLKPVKAVDFLPNADERLVATIHPGFFNKTRDLFTYDENPDSTAYIAPDSGKYYFAGGLNGGLTSDFLAAMEEMNNGVLQDDSHNIIARWHDESHWNKFLLGKEDKIKKLSPAYLYPEGWNLPFEKIILIRDKERAGGHDFLRGEKNNIFKRANRIFKRILKKILL